ncbi:acyl carrier protein [Methylosinus sporium]|uniref:Acyl carrier protein n=1 Tax=Methylosinus sporium TaxID=428 RepID=A0A2U1SMI6_METSR|nr:acyl carrier protein [Methylosinus sporium]PWB92828.1 hypothetical protein C5689_16155 [Methylosinus sporium]
MKNTDRELFYDKMRQFICARSGFSPEKIAPDTALISSGLLDSLAVSESVFFVEDFVGRPIEIDDFRMMTFNSMEHIYNTYIAPKP